MLVKENKYKTYSFAFFIHFHSFSIETLEIYRISISLTDKQPYTTLNNLNVPTDFDRQYFLELPILQSPHQSTYTYILYFYIFIKSSKKFNTFTMFLPIFHRHVCISYQEIRHWKIPHMNKYKVLI